MGLGPRFGSQHNCSHQEWPAIRPRSFIYFFGLCLFQSVRKSINVKIWGPWNALQVLPLSATASNNFPQKQQLAPSCLQGKSTNGTAGKQLFWQMHVPLQIVRRWPFKKVKGLNHSEVCPKMGSFHGLCDSQQNPKVRIWGFPHFWTNPAAKSAGYFLNLFDWQDLAS